MGDADAEYLNSLCDEAMDATEGGWTLPKEVIPDVPDDDFPTTLRKHFPPGDAFKRLLFVKYMVATKRISDE